MTDPENNAPGNSRPIRSRRSVLYVPASNARALEKAATLASDSVIVDLEDAVGPDEKRAARQAVQTWFLQQNQPGKEYVIRINALSSEWGLEDIRAACRCGPGAILLPKVNAAEDILRAEDLLAGLSAPPELRLWAMIETPRAIANSMSIAATGNRSHARLDCLIAGTNDLAKDTGVQLLPGRPYLSVWLMQLVLAARTAGLDVLDGVYNDFRDDPGFEVECRDGSHMGFDGKTLIHPSQIETANMVFGASETDLEAARSIVETFLMPENTGKGVIQIAGQMVERLHLEQARSLLAKAAARK
jgi:citrate lyase subunit beta/citryl-CoA lyase